MVSGMQVSAISGARQSPAARRASMLQDATLVVVSGLFFSVHGLRVADGHLASVPFAAEQALLVGMFLTRRRSIATSTRPLDWVVATGGWLPLLMRPAAGGPEPAFLAGTAMQMAGLGLTCVAFLYLGRSFGVVAANRGLKVNGPYRLVRHPIYFSHFVTTSGFLLANFTAWNLAAYVGMAVCQVMRIEAEERVLSETGAYAAYRARVRWRLLPGVY